MGLVCNENGTQWVTLTFHSKPVSGTQWAWYAMRLGHNELPWHFILSLWLGQNEPGRLDWPPASLSWIKYAITHRSSADLYTQCEISGVFFCTVLSISVWNQWVFFLYSIFKTHQFWVFIHFYYHSLIFYLLREICFEKTSSRKGCHQVTSRRSHLANAWNTW